MLGRKDRVEDAEGVGPSVGVGVCSEYIPYTARVPCGLRTVIVIPIDALKIPDAGRIHAIHGQGVPKLYAGASGTIRKKVGKEEGMLGRRLGQKAEVSGRQDLDRQERL